MHSTEPDTVADRLSHAVHKVSSSGMGNFQDQGCDRTSAALCLQQSIARFGNRRRQHILKRCEEAFSYTVGERTRESFFHDENTAPVTAVKAVASNVWMQPHDPSATCRTHRVMLPVSLTFDEANLVK